MPGVVVTTAVRTGPSTINISPSSSFFVVGSAERGPITGPRLVTSLADFQAWYGGYNASHTLHQHVKTYFEEGGARCYVTRVTGGSVTAGTLTLNGAGAVPSLRIDAANPGSWSSTVSIEVVTQGIGAVVRVYLNGAQIYSTGEVATAAAAAARLNSSTTVAPYIVTTVLSGSLALVARTVTALSAGTNGTAPTDVNLVAALSSFGAELGAGAVAIPEQFSVATYEGLRTHAIANNRIALCGFSPTATAADAVSTSSNYSGAGGEYMAFYYPEINVPGDGGTTLTISPESYVAAKRSVAHNSIGSWQAAAGVVSQAKYVTGLAAPINKATGDLLDAGRVNAIRIIQGSVRIYGARSAAIDEDNWRYITFRDTLNHVVVEAEKRLEDLVFSSIDGRRSVFGKVESRLVALMEPMRRQGGLYEAFDAEGNMLDPGYSVDVSDALNPVSQLATGLVVARVGMRVSSVGDKIEVTVYKSNLTNSVV